MKNIEDIKILVVGDIMLDRYVVGHVKRLSAEAPVPVIDVIKEYSTLGGCGNVAKNLATLGVQTSCISRVGKDKSGKEIKKHLKELSVYDYVSIEDDYITIQKERIMSEEHQVQMLRIDREVIKDCSYEITKYLNEILSMDFDVVIVSDYAKGMITEKTMESLSSSEKIIILDPKPKNYNLYRFKDIFLITPNNEEYEQLLAKNQFKVGGGISQHTLRTMGKDGMTLYDNIDNNIVYIPSDPVKVYNVSGAGDTVIATFSICLVMGFSLVNCAKISNECARYVVTQPGTSYVPRKLFDQIISKYT